MGKKHSGEDEPTERQGKRSVDGGDEQRSDPEVPEQRSDYRIENVRQLKVLWHPLRLRIMEEMGHRGQATPTQVARALGESAPKIHYHVRELLKVGLVEEAETRPKGGVLEHYYRPVAGNFEVAGDIALKANKRGLRGPVSAGMELLFSEAMQAITRCVELKAEAGPSGESLPVFGGMSASHMRLTKEQAKEIWRRFGDMLKEYEEVDKSGVRRSDGEGGGAKDRAEGGGDDAFIYGIITAIYAIRPDTDSSQ